MATEIELAVMAGRAYQSTRNKDYNWFPAPDGWEEPIEERKVLPSGFEAGYFSRGSGSSQEIVISFAGTYDKDKLGDIAADIALGNGYYTAQLKEAAEYYLQIKAANPDAKITLTGHSLGGGLASLIAVFFNEKAVTFDQAPFRLTATYQSPDIDPYEFLLFALQDNTAIAQNLLQPLQEYVDAMRQGSMTLLQKREKGVSNIRVDGEFLSDIFPISKVDFIGTTSPANVLTHGATDLGGMKLHSMALLTAFVQNPAFREVTNRLTDLLGMIFDKNLYAYDTDPNSENTNFLEHLLRHEFGNAPGVTTADGMLTLSAGAGNDTLTGGIGRDSLDGGAGDDTYIFNLGDGADTITHYDAAGVDTISFGAGIVIADINLAAKVGNNLVLTIGNSGDQLTINNWFAGTAYQIDRFSFADTTVKTGAELLAALPVYENGTADNDYLQGYEGVDIMIGGAGNDTLTGLAGNDTLTGGQGADTVDGWTGNDTYIFNIGDGEDTINNYDTAGVDTVSFGAGIDTISFGAGIVLADINQATKVDNNLILRLGNNGDQLTINNRFYNRPANQIDRFVFADGTVKTGNEILAGLPNYVNGTVGNDTLYGYDGVDIMNGGIGNDHIYGYAGDDSLYGGEGGDSLGGDEGNDLLVGASNDTYIFNIFCDDVNRLEHVEFANGSYWDGAVSLLPPP